MMSMELENFLDDVSKFSKFISNFRKCLENLIFLHNLKCFNFTDEIYAKIYKTIEIK